MTKHHAHPRHGSSAAAHHGARATQHKKPAKSADIHLHPKHSAVALEPLAPLSLLAWPLHTLELLMSPFISQQKKQKTKTFPRIYHTETPKAYISKIELPDIEVDQLSLSFQNGNIMLRVKLPRYHADSHRYNIWRSVHRALPLPVYTNGSAISADFKVGLLTIIVPKSERPVAPKVGSLNIHTA